MKCKCGASSVFAFWNFLTNRMMGTSYPVCAYFVFVFSDSTLEAPWGTIKIRHITHCEDSNFPWMLEDVYKTVHLIWFFGLIRTFTCSFPLTGWYPISLYNETGYGIGNDAPGRSLLCCLALHAETTIYDVIRNDVGWQYNELGLWGSPDVHNALSVMDKDPPLESQGSCILFLGSLYAVAWQPREQLSPCYMML